jgi:GNAT superfamily N-acetyltransferase
VIEVVPVDVAELGRVVSVHNAVRADDPTTVEELVDWKRQAEDMTWLVATADGEDAGAAVGLVGWHSEPGTAFGEFWTLPDARGRGVGTALLVELGRWSAEQGSAALDTVVAEDDEASLAWAQRRGLREVGRDSRLVLDLDAIEAPAVEAPEGIDIGTWAERPGIERGLYQVYVESEPDIPGEEHNEVPPFEKWLSNDMQGLSDRPEAVFVALEGDEVVGFAKLAFPAEGSRVFHDLTGVRRAWRRRGIAAALKQTQIAWAKRQGYAQLVTGNEQRNEPIRRLNERHGYRVEPGRVVLRADLSGAA